MPVHILTIEVQYTEMSINLFMTFWILIQILWQSFIDFHVYIVPFYYSYFANISSIISR